MECFNRKIIFLAKFNELAIGHTQILLISVSTGADRKIIVSINFSVEFI